MDKYAILRCWLWKWAVHGWTIVWESRFWEQREVPTTEVGAYQTLPRLQDRVAELHHGHCSVFFLRGGGVVQGARCRDEYDLWCRIETTIIIIIIITIFILEVCEFYPLASTSRNYCLNFTTNLMLKGAMSRTTYWRSRESPSLGIFEASKSGG